MSKAKPLQPFVFSRILTFGAIAVCLVFAFGLPAGAQTVPGPSSADATAAANAGGNTAGVDLCLRLFNPATCGGSGSSSGSGSSATANGTTNAGGDTSTVKACVALFGPGGCTGSGSPSNPGSTTDVKACVVLFGAAGCNGSGGSSATGGTTPAKSGTTETADANAAVSGTVDSAACATLNTTTAGLLSGRAISGNERMLWIGGLLLALLAGLLGGAILARRRKDEAVAK